MQEYPLCFSSKADHQEWLRLKVAARFVKDTICDDCTYQYRMKMKEEGRCQSHQARFFSSSSLLEDRK